MPKRAPSDDRAAKPGVPSPTATAATRPRPRFISTGRGRPPARSRPRAKTSISTPASSPIVADEPKPTVTPGSMHRPTIPKPRLSQNMTSAGRRQAMHESRLVRSQTTTTEGTDTSIPERTAKSCIAVDNPKVAKVLKKYKGVWPDLFMITNTYEQSGSKSFKDFLLLCEEKKIMEMFRGIPNLRLLLEFTETVMLRCKEMWLETNTLQKQVSWFYLLCVMYLHQPKALLSLSNVVQIRLVKNDHGAICKFVLQTRSLEIGDVDLMFKVLRSKHAFSNHLTSLNYGLEKSFTMYFVEDMEKAEFMNQSVVFPRLLYSLQDRFTKLNNDLQEYCKAKESVISMELDHKSRIELAESLSNIQPNFVDELISCLPPERGTDIPSTSVEAGPSRPAQVKRIQ